MTRSMTAADRGINKKRGTRRNNRVTFGTPAESIVQSSETQGSENIADSTDRPEVEVIFCLSEIPNKAAAFSTSSREDEYKNSSLNSDGSVDSKKRKKSLVDAHLPKLMGMTIPDDGWVIEIKDYGEGGDYDSGKSWTIFRIPRNMYEISKSAYTPKIVSIGPLTPLGLRVDHVRYKAMEEHKKRYLLRLLGYTGTKDARNSVFDDFESDVGERSSSYTRAKPVGLGTLVNAMQDLEKITRKCYSEAIHMKKKNSFVQMMVMDGCFIIELLRLYHKYLNNNKDVDDPIFTTRWMLCTLQRDLLMLENQLPLHVLEVLFHLTKRQEDPDVSLLDLILQFFNPLLRRDEKYLKVDPDKKYDHMLDVFRSSFLPIPVIGPVEDPTKMKDTLHTHSATELEEAGIKFSKKSELGVTDLLNIQFHRSTGTLDIPPLQIDDTTVPLFLNFMAYEQCDRDAEPYFTNHFMFLDRLVNTAKDIEILHTNGVINHALGSDKDVANLINKLSREIIYDADTCHLRQHMRELNMYYEKCSVQWYVWFKTLKRDYFSSPWKVASLFAAIILLLLTFCQTFFSFYGYFKPPK
ncbi:hypothetical protein MKW98_003974 [Papaver atlanticum]|uniref:Uncharacterized protein n=1 Tax=Papaver atlanticum TaxID=357466 RepID=A0AAD4XHN3_9MAGN|nr:hypothetical protein MKW98_003974 [Papaver atlanticum]